MRVVNFIGAPGAGKSTEAARLFAWFKDQGSNCEMVREYAKELCWEGKLTTTPQLEIYMEQRRRLEILRGKVDVVFTDSPLPLMFVYAADLIDSDALLERQVIQDFLSFDNITFFVPRKKPYNPAGRLETSIESFARQAQIEDVKNKYPELFVNSTTYDSPQYAMQYLRDRGWLK